MWEPRKPGKVRAKWPICDFDAGNSNTSSRAPAMNMEGWRTTQPRQGARSSHDRAIVRYQFSPPRKPACLNSAAKYARSAGVSQLGSVCGSTVFSRMPFPRSMPNSTCPGASPEPLYRIRRKEASTSSSELSLGHARRLEILDVEVLNALLVQRGQKLDAARRREGHAHADDGAKDVRSQHCRMPCNRRAPVVADDHSLTLAQHLDEIDYVANQVQLCEAVDVRRRFGAAVAAHVRRHRTVARRRQRRKLVSPGVPGLGPAVTKQHQRACPLLRDPHADAVHLQGVKRRPAGRLHTSGHASRAA